MQADLIKLVQDLADDLEAELNARYRINGEIHPAEQRRFDRDMTNVYRAHDLLGHWR